MWSFVVKHILPRQHMSKRHRCHVHARSVMCFLLAWCTIFAAVSAPCLVMSGRIRALAGGVAVGYASYLYTTRQVTTCTKQHTQHTKHSTQSTHTQTHTYIHTRTHVTTCTRIRRHGHVTAQTHPRTRTMRMNM